MSDTAKFGRMAPVNPRDIICVYCSRNATEALFSKVVGDGVCQTCQKDLREGRTPKSNRPPAYTDAHTCSECGNYKSFRRSQCKRCHFRTDITEEEKQEDMQWNKSNLEAWISARRKRLRQTI